MYSFKISSGQSWYTEPAANNRLKGEFLSETIQAFYHSDYQGGNNEIRNNIGTIENIITTLKNQFKEKSDDVLKEAVKNLKQILIKDLPQILEKMNKNELTVCVIPRAKNEANYTSKQLLFKKAVQQVIDNLDGFIDGTDYITRHTNTRTTHLDRSGYGGDGDLPYPGITKKTCKISKDLKGKDILLIDDLYTESINIDEDAIQALLDNGAKSVIFYSLGKTLKQNNATL